MTERLVPNSARFPDQTIDDETLLFDADTGNLVLLTGFGSVVWTHLLAGADAAAIAAGVAERFGSEAAEATRAFIGELRTAEMIVPSAAPPEAIVAVVAWPAAFTAPAIERYDDIAKIIAMDPIHDVDATTGWPRAAPDGEV
ncbi:MAG: PqqD family peptide modification chaperone [Bauldia sp.]|nr:PqqD family peptide modification chaperone [Bauldia sp.]